MFIENDLDLLVSFLLQHMMSTYMLYRYIYTYIDGNNR